MTIKEIEEFYVVSKRKKNYNLYSKTENGVYSPIKYLCSIEKRGTYFNVIGFDKTNKIEELVSQVDKKFSSYKYNSEFY